MRLHRLIGIILIIESKGVVKAKDLADALETSERTIYRDVDILCEAGIPIVSTPGPTGGFSFMPGFRMDMKNMYADDIIHLLLSSMGIHPQASSESSISLKNALLKLEGSVPKEYIPDIEKAKTRFFFDPAPWWREMVPAKNIDIIRQALWNSKKLFIKYKKNAYEASERILCPYGLIVKSSEWYLIAYCESRKDIRSFKCSRITFAELLDIEFIPPTDFNLEKYWSCTVQSFKALAKHRHVATYPVTIATYAKKDEILPGFEVLEEYCLGDDYFYTYDLISYTTACSVVFTSSDVIKIVSPLELRDYVVKKAENILKLNNL